jgi:hypothetical protein
VILNEYENTAVSRFRLLEQNAVEPNILQYNTMMTNLTNDDDLSGGGGGGGGGNKGEHYANFNVLSNHTSFIDADNNNGSIQHRADCNLIAMQPFYYNNEPYLSGIAR